MYLSYKHGRRTEIAALDPDLEHPPDGDIRGDRGRQANHHYCSIILIVTHSVVLTQMVSTLCAVHVALYAVRGLFRTSERTHLAYKAKLSGI